MDKNCVEVKYICNYLYCVVDRTGQDRPDSHFFVSF